MQRIHAYTPASSRTVPLPNWIFTLSWHPASHQLASAHMDFAVRIWDLRLSDTDNPAQTLTHDKFAVSVAWHPSGELIASSDAQGNGIYFWDARSGEQIDNLIEHIGWPYGLAWRNDGQQLASAGADGRVLLWDTYGRYLIRTLWQFKHQDERGIGFHTLQWSPDGGILVAISTEGHLYRWDTIDWRLRIFQIPDIGREDTLVAFSPDSARAAMLSNTGDILLMNLRNANPQVVGRLPLTLPDAGNERFRAINWSADGARIAVARGSNQVIVFDRGQPLPALFGGLAEITALAWSPDSSMLAAGDNEGKIHIWQFPM